MNFWRQQYINFLIWFVFFSFRLFVFCQSTLLWISHFSSQQFDAHDSSKKKENKFLNQIALISKKSLRYLIMVILKQKNYIISKHWFKYYTEFFEILVLKVEFIAWHLAELSNSQFWKVERECKQLTNHFDFSVLKRLIYWKNKRKSLRLKLIHLSIKSFIYLLR